MAPHFEWLNEPPRWEESGGVLSIDTGDKTDFWRETHYGFIHDNGHFRYREVSGDFTATLEFSAAYEEQYDQAGVMLRIDERNWIKAGIEFVDGRQTLGAVVTRDFSDWSTMPLPENPGWLTLRCQRSGSSVQIEWREGRNEFKLLRLAYLPPSALVRVGPMCCSPTRAGLETTFRRLEIVRAVSEPGHSAAQVSNVSPS